MRNRGRTGWCLAASVAAMIATAPLAAYAVIVGGGGNSRSDCLLVLSTNANTPAARPKHVRCVDGDAACDADGIVNGICEVPVAVCANSTMLSSCSLVGVDNVVVDHSADDGIDPDFNPDFQALQSRIDTQILDDNPNTNPDDCTTSAAIRVPIKGPLGANKCSKKSKTLRITTTSGNLAGTVYTDKDRLKITCVPADEGVGGCDPQILFSGSFDRLQKQVFNQSCAVATCHDSNSTTGDLLLETGSSYSNLANVDPSNGAALGQGWKRVTPGDSATSFILHKVSGDLPDASYGGRMPLSRRKLHSSLQTIIQLWIDAGAPPSGWVAGTY